MKNLVHQLRLQRQSYWRNMAILFLLLCTFGANAQQNEVYATTTEDGQAYVSVAVGNIDLNIINGRVSIYPPKNVTITYVTSDFYPEIKGRIASINGLALQYYTSSFYPELKGKLIGIGDTEISYYTGDFYPEIKGKVKSIGNVSIQYYTGDFYPEIKGKVKSIGNMQITYYTGDFYPEVKGKVKSISDN